MQPDLDILQRWNIENERSGDDLAAKLERVQALGDEMAEVLSAEREASRFTETVDHYADAMPFAVPK
jgi:hypothetical protein